MKYNVNILRLILVILLPQFASPTYSQTDYEIYPAKGLCRDSIKYQEQMIASDCIRGIIYYTNSLFPYQQTSRSYILSSGEVYSKNSMICVEWVYDVELNEITRIDSSESRHLGYRDGKEIQYMGIINDTIVYWIAETNSIESERISDHSRTSLPPSRLELFSRLSYLHQEIHNNNITYYSLSKDLNVAYSNNKTNTITIYTSKGEIIEFPANMGGKVLGWLDEKHLLYADISVEGFGDFYYDVFVLDITTRDSTKVLSKVCNVYDYHHGQLIYESDPRKIVVAQLFFDNRWSILDRQRFDLSNHFLWVYEMCMIDEYNFVIMGDTLHGSAFMLYKLQVQTGGALH